jgi:hypothetical protein
MRGHQPFEFHSDGSAPVCPQGFDAPRSGSRTLALGLAEVSWRQQSDGRETTQRLLLER